MYVVVKQVCVQIAPCHLHFALCLLKAVVALRGKQVSCLVFCWARRGPQGITAGPKAEGFVLGPCRHGFALSQQRTCSYFEGSLQARNASGHLYVLSAFHLGHMAWAGHRAESKTSWEELKRC